MTNLTVTEPVADFKGMEKLSSLKTLTIYELKGTARINSLSRIENLTVLELATSPTPLECLTKLQTLTLQGADSTNLAFLGARAGLPKLKTLDISSTAILDLSPALAHPALRLLIATDNAGLLPTLRGLDAQITYRKPIGETNSLTIVVDQWIYEELHQPLGDVWVKPAQVAVKPGLCGRYCL